MMTWTWLIFKKGCKSNLTLNSLEPKSPDILTCFTNGSDRHDVSNHLMSPVHFDAGACSITVFIAKYQSHDGRHLILVYLQA